ncbi:MAG: PepSY-associated TM helix domain-containing protein, partial [Sphingomonas sp.]
RFVTILHRWLSLAALAFWVVQALTGVLIVFHWEIDDALIVAPHRLTSFEAIDRRLALLAPAGSRRSIGSVWTSAGAPDRWDVTVSDAQTGTSDAVRIDGRGNVLRVRHDGERFANGGWIDTLVLLHQTLLGGNAGSWIVGLSGTLLISNLVMGLVMSWPLKRLWKRSLTPPRTGPPAARLYGWHRALGLWVVIPAVLLVSAGVVRVFADGFERLIGAPPALVAAIKPGQYRIAFARAVSIAVARKPGAIPAGIDFPTAEDATWHIRLLAKGEPRRAYGMTTVWVNGNDGSIVGDVDAVHAPFARRFADLVYPLHTGELAGLPGRLAVMAIGLWLLSMIGIGASLWFTRSRLRKGKR